jgi:hypothetical protein
VWNGAGFGTALTCLAFNTLQLIKVEESKLASPAGFEAVLPPQRLRFGGELEVRRVA